MRLAITFLPGLFLGLVLAGCDRQKAPQPQGEAAGSSSVGAKAGSGSSAFPQGRVDRSRAGRPAPEALFEDPDGEPARLADFRGRPLLVNLWATWCAPCVVEMPSLDALAQRPEGDIQVLALSQDFAGRQAVTEYFERQDFSRLEPYLDSEMKLMTEAGVDTLPTTILFDAQGREIWRVTGILDWNGQEARRLLSEAEAS